jgi:hypothetical protein
LTAPENDRQNFAVHRHTNTAKVTPAMDSCVTTV